VEIANAARDAHLVPERPQDVIAPEKAEEIRERPEDRPEFLGPHGNEAAHYAVQ
jgi:hypothetical protein